MIREFPKKYIKKGNFKLHSGDYSNILYDVNSMLTDRYFYKKIINFIERGVIFPENRVGSYVGIATGGAIIASHFPHFEIVKDGELKGKIAKKYCLIDDVCTTEASIKEAIKIIGRKPKHIFVIVDRRAKRTLKIRSMYEI